MLCYKNPARLRSKETYIIVSRSAWSYWGITCICCNFFHELKGSFLPKVMCTFDYVYCLHENLFTCLVFIFLLYMFYFHDCQKCLRKVFSCCRSWGKGLDTCLEKLKLGSTFLIKGACSLCTKPLAFIIHIMLYSCL